MTVQKAQMPAVCARCGAEFPEAAPEGRPRKWCSERCRESARREARIEAEEASGVRVHDDDGYFERIRASMRET